MALIEFKDLPNTSTPLNAENLNNNFNELNRANTYSTDEQVIGSWLDGKPLYKKTYNIASLANAGMVQIPFEISNLKEVVSIRGIATDGANFFTLPSYRGAVGTGIQIYADINNGISIVTENDRSSYHAYITIEYTKTTD